MIGKTLVACAAALALALPGTASAAPPANDDFANATPIGSVPFSDSIVVDEATMEVGQENVPCGLSSSEAQTAWYAYTPSSSGVVRISQSGSFYYRFIAAYRQDGSGLGGLANVACASWYYGQPAATFTAEAGKTYYIQAGSNFVSSGSLDLAVQLVAPPANDDFASAQPVATLPFSGSADTTAAGIEAGEPAPSCGYGPPAGSVWYAFTAPAAGSYTASSPYNGFWAQVAAYRGGSVATLSELACRTFGQPLTFHAEAGQTTYLQVGGIFGSRGTVILNVDVAPAPVAGFGYSPGDPSVFDTVQFFDQSYDPAQAGIQSTEWDFGDGATSASPGCCPQHRYLVDGDYTVRLAVTTIDGRTASSSQELHVRTHDVTITKVTVPQSASAGQTRSITVGITDNRYPEQVEVQLLKSTPQGWVLVGLSRQSVPVRGANRSTSFAFNYTFTGDDAALGKVSFRAVATIVGARDALQADNDVTALPTKVAR